MRPAGDAAFAARREDRTGVYSFEQRREPRRSTPDEEARFRANEAAWAWFAGAAAVVPHRRDLLGRRAPSGRRRGSGASATLIEDSAAGRPIKPLTAARRAGR